MDIFTTLVHQPVYNLLIVLYRAFGGDLGLAIIGIALLSRVITFPITVRQIRMAEKSQEFNARVKEVKAKHKGDKETEQAEMLKLQSEFLPGQLAGCLPLVVQFVLLITILNVVRALLSPGGVEDFNQFAYSFVPQFSAEAVINTHFLGVIDLGVHPAEVTGGLLAVAPYIVLAVLVAGSQYFSTKIMTGRRKQREAAKAAKEGKDPTEGKGDKKKQKKAGSKGDEKPEDFGEIMQRSTQQTMVILPLLVGVMSWNFPAGLSLYWTVQSGFVIIQQFVMDRLQKEE